MSDLAHRVGSVELTLLGPHGSPVGTPVSIRQASHAFGFGNIGFELMDVATGGDGEPAITDAWLGLFN